MESFYLFGFDNDIQSFCKDEEIKENQNIVLNYANNNNNEIKLKINKLEEKIVIVANKNKLIQVFVNLIENSISLSPKGSQILIELNKLEEDKIGITFYDQGVGVELKSSERIFDRFYTDRQNNLKNHTGLGLSIAREIITHMNGKITLKKSDKSDYSGACFLIILPVRHSS